MPAVLLWPLIAGSIGAVGGFVVGAKSSNLAALGISAAAILYFLKGR